MFFDALRKRSKGLIILIAAAFALGLLYVGVPFFGGNTASGAQVIATVNGSDISYFEHQTAFQNLAYQYQMIYGPLSAADQEFLQYQALEMVMTTKLALDAARKEGIRVAKAEIDEKLQEQRALFDSDAEYRQALRNLGMTESDLRRLIEEELLIGKVLERREAEVEISEEDLAQAYEAVNARHILIRPEVVDGEQDWDGALAKANELLEQLRAGADFALLAAEHSADGTAEQGGVLGFFPRGVMVPEFEEAAFALQPGEISPEPVRTQFGYHIIEVLERRLPEGEEYENAKEGLRVELQAQRAGERVQEWLRELRDNADIDVKDPLLKAIWHVANSEYTEAIENYKVAETQSPNDGYINYSMGNVYQVLGDTEQAIEQYRLATTKNPYDPELHYMLGQALIDADRTDEGVQSLVTAAEWAPNDYGLLYQVHNTLTLLGYTEEAETVQGMIDDLIDRYQQQLELQQQLEQLESSESASGDDITSLLDAEAEAAQERLAQEQEEAAQDEADAATE